MATVSMGVLGYFVSNRSIFFFVMICALPTILTLIIIRPDEIDYDLARGAKKGEEAGKYVGPSALLKDRLLVIFLVCAVMFHFANAAMLPLLGEMLAKGQGRSSMMFMSACVVTTQLVVALLASWSGRFNLTLGAIGTAVGIGASLSQVIAGSIVHHFGSNAGFLFLAAIASVAFGILFFFMPETRDKKFLNPSL